MKTDLPLPLLGGLSAARFMQRHWQKTPHLIRQAVPGIAPPVSRAELLALAARDDVESRLVVQGGAAGWQLRHGPFQRRQIPPWSRPGWTLLVQGLDLHVGAARELLSMFRFVPEARLDDLMISYASPGGGVGPHVDSYDVFLLQVSGHRRWRCGPVDDPTLVEGMPVKLLAHFEPTETWDLGPGDMLYVPPGWGHDGVALDADCMTCSVGFRAPGAAELARDVLQRMAEALDPEAGDTLYRDPARSATETPGRVPESLAAFARRAVERALKSPRSLACALGEVLTEPKPLVWFESGAALQPGQGLQLAHGTRMMYDDDHVFINGESFRAAGRDARLMRALADERALGAADAARLSEDAWGLADEWSRSGWIHGA
jgi:50S ribosomal protein L16 3-hydroxylase